MHFQEGLAESGNIRPYEHTLPFVASLVTWLFFVRTAAVVSTMAFVRAVMVFERAHVCRGYRLAAGEVIDVRMMQATPEHHVCEHPKHGYRMDQTVHDLAASAGEIVPDYPF